MAESYHIHWSAAPAGFSLGSREVHVWAADLRLTDELAAIYQSTLSSDELLRASRYFFQRDGKRFIAGRGILRSLLGRYLSRHPAQIQIVYSQRGKPSLAGLSPREEIHFNLAHSDDLAVFAISRIPGIGIDIEHLRRVDEADSIAERFFSARETKAMRTLPPAQRQAGFFNLWTRKEAWLKATGEGIGESLNRVEVSVKPGEPARLLRIHNDAHAAAEWTLRELVPAPGFLGALAVPAKEFTVNCWQWQDDKALNLRSISPMHGNVDALRSIGNFLHQ